MPVMTPSAPSNAAPSVLGKGTCGNLQIVFYSLPIAQSVLALLQVTEIREIWKCSR